MMETQIIFLLLFFVNLGCAVSEISLRFVFILESHEKDLTGNIGEALKAVEDGNPELRLSDDVVFLDRENEEESYGSLCSAVSKGVSMILDVSWSPWQKAEQFSADAGVPLVRTVLGSQQLIGALDQYLEWRNVSDAAILLETEMDVDRTLYHLLGASRTRVWVQAALSRESARALRGMRPEPSAHVLAGASHGLSPTYTRAVKEKLVRREYRWILAITDYAPLDTSVLVLPTMILQADSKECCKLMGKEDCECPRDFQRKQLLLNSLLQLLAEVSSKLDPPSTTVDCEDLMMNGTRERFHQLLAEETAGNETLFYWDRDKYSLLLRTRFVLSSYADEEQETVASWSAQEQFRLLPGVTLEPLRMFFRIGTSAAVPWTYPKLDSETGEPIFTEEGQPIYEGYCIDLIQRLSETMEFDYEIVTPQTGSFGRKLSNGTWDGVVGDLMRGETDLAVSALTMTAEREEVIDFVPPYFEQTGILIGDKLEYLCVAVCKANMAFTQRCAGCTLMYIQCRVGTKNTSWKIRAHFKMIRKPTRKTSLFKFMTVLRTEVWLSIVAALVLTGFMIWLLDKYSPYSARNNPDAYPYPCREFTLKESFWFALTSFTPQGGGEAPKALSGRTLVAAYWLFVVLMLATFTANLAAFLTVERMQTPVSSLEQLARQSRINYTVVEGSTIHQYFINMKFAEDTLYRVWKEITLNATSDQSQYRVWDYPIREQYGHILLAINASGPVPDAKTGFQQVNEHTDADFAFIHDSAEIRYEITRNCNLTEVGEVFAEQPYAIAVQQGSRLQEDLSRALLDLQKERFLEQLGAKYWNETARQSCPDADESEGITLESLGGVFIATLFGLGLAMITLAWEVFYYKRKEKNKVQDIDAKVEKQAFAETKKSLEKKVVEGVSKLRKRVKKNVTIGEKFKPVAGEVSYISVYPKGGYRP